MAVYLASFNGPRSTNRRSRHSPPNWKARPRTRIVAASSAGARLYQGACAVCHEVGGPPLFGSRPSLALNSNLHSARAGQSDPGDPARHRLAGVQRPRLYAGLQGQHDRRPGRRARHLPAAAIRPGKPAWTGVGGRRPGPASAVALSCHAPAETPLVAGLPAG